MKCSMRNAVRLRLLIGVLSLAALLPASVSPAGCAGRHHRLDGGRGHGRQHGAGAGCTGDRHPPALGHDLRGGDPGRRALLHSRHARRRTVQRHGRVRRRRRHGLLAADQGRRQRSTSASSSDLSFTVTAIAVQEEVTVTAIGRPGVQLEPHRRRDLGRTRGDRPHADAERPDQRRDPPDAAVERQQLRRRRQPDEQHHGGRLVVQQLVRPGRPARRPHRRRADLARGDRADPGERRALRRAAGQLHRRRRQHRHAQRQQPRQRRRSITASAIRTGSAPKPRARSSTPARSRSGTPAAGRRGRSSRTSGSRSATTRTSSTSAR